MTLRKSNAIQNLGFSMIHAMTCELEMARAWDVEAWDGHDFVPRHMQMQLAGCQNAGISSRDFQEQTFKLCIVESLH